MANVTIDLLKEHTGVTDEQLCSVCSNEHLNKIADDIENYLQYAHALGLKDRQIAEIRTNVGLTFLLKTQKVLSMWKNDNIFTATYQRLVEAALLLGHGTLAEKICQLCKELSVETGTSLRANNTDPNTGEADLGVTSPEHQALVENINLLRSTIAQDPQGIGNKMLAKNLLARAQRSELRIRTTTNVDKARIIVDAIVNKTEGDEKYFKVFVQILKSAGSWTKYLVNSLVRSLDRCTQERSLPSEDVNEDIPIVHPSTPPPSAAQEQSLPSEEENGAEVDPIVHPDSTPKMIQLLHFKPKTGASVNIAESIGTYYKIFGVCLLDNHNQVSNHEHGCYMKPVCTVVETLGDWLNGKGKTPVTWSTLVKCVEVSGLSALAGDITGQYSTSVEKK